MCLVQHALATAQGMESVMQVNAPVILTGLEKIAKCLCIALQTALLMAYVAMGLVSVILDLTELTVQFMLDALVVCRVKRSVMVGGPATMEGVFVMLATVVEVVIYQWMRKMMIGNWMSWRHSVQMMVVMCAQGMVGVSLVFVNAA